MRRLPSPIVLRTALLAPIFLVAACGDGAGPTPPLTGSYTLRTVDGLGLPALYACGASVSSGTLAITSDSVVFNLTTGQGSDVWVMEARRSYTRSADGKQLFVSLDVPELTDTVTVGSGGRLTYRALLPVSAPCTGTNSVRVDLGFRHD